MKESYFKVPKWKFWICKMYPFNIIPLVNKSFSLKEPLWKDKYNYPRVEQVPFVEIILFGYSFYFIKGDESYWERHLFIHKYSNGDEQLAIDTWEWVDGVTRVSTWFKKNN